MKEATTNAYIAETNANRTSKRAMLGMPFRCIRHRLEVTRRGCIGSVHPLCGECATGTMLRAGA